MENKAQAYLTFQSTPSVWRATQPRGLRGGPSEISIHALRVEGDDRGFPVAQVGRRISIHALRVEGDP